MSHNKSFSITTPQSECPWTLWTRPEFKHKHFNGAFKCKKRNLVLWLISDLKLDRSCTPAERAQKPEVLDQEARRIADLLKCGCSPEHRTTLWEYSSHRPGKLPYSYRVVSTMVSEVQGAWILVWFYSQDRILDLCHFMILCCEIQIYGSRAVAIFFQLPLPSNHLISV